VLKTDVAYIHANFSFVAVYKKLENTANFLSVTLRELNEIQDKLHKINGSEADIPKQQFRSCLSKNYGSKAVCDISCALEKT
jgi:hypothetical protein